MLNNEAPFMSVIIPVYNSKDYLRPCLESIVSQADNISMEIIMVNDGSTDGSGALCDELAELYPQVAVSHQKNGGASCARNKGLKICRGQYIFFIDSDDTIAHNGITVIMNALKSYDFPDMLIFDGRRVNEQGKGTQKRVSGVFPAGLVPAGKKISLYETKELLFEFPSACFRVVKRDIYFNNDIFFPEGLLFEDNLIIPSLLACSKSIVYIDVTIYNYFSRPISASRQGPAVRSKDIDRRVNDIITVFNLLFDWFEKKELLEEYHSQLAFKAAHEILIVQAVTVLQVGGSRTHLNKLVDAVEALDKEYISNPYLIRSEKKTQQKIRIFAKRHYFKLTLIFKFTGLLRKIRRLLFGNRDNRRLLNF